jgi:hypothetical protein
MFKELLVILVNEVVDPKRIIRKKWRAEEEERHKGSLTQKGAFLMQVVLLEQVVQPYVKVVYV